MSQCSTRVEEERDKTNRGSHNRDTHGRERCMQRRLCMIRSTTRPEVIPENFCHP